MKSTSAGTLEFYRLRDLVGRFVSSPLGRRELAKVEPHSDRAALEADHAETGEAIGYLRSGAIDPETGHTGLGEQMELNYAGITPPTPCCIPTTLALREHLLVAGGAALDAWYVCPHHPHATVVAYRCVPAAQHVHE